MSAISSSSGVSVERWSPLEAQRQGIAVMHQHPGLFPDLTVFENIFIGHMPRGPLGVDYEAMRERAARLLGVVGLSCRPEDTLKRLRTSEQQLVEIARALSVNAKVLIMDEPTAALSQREVERLFAVVAGLKARQVAMMFVSHRMEEIYRIADHIAVLARRSADRRSAGRRARSRSGDPDDDRPIARRHLSAAADKAGRGSPGGRRSDARRGLRRRVLQGSRRRSSRPRADWWAAGVPRSRVCFSASTSRAQAAFGSTGKKSSFTDPAAAMRAGIAYVSEDRLGQSLVLDFSILANASLPVIGKATLAGLVMRRRELALVEPHLLTAAPQVPKLRPAGEDAVRRQPAKGRPLQMARDHSARP